MRGYDELSGAWGIRRPGANEEELEASAWRGRKHEEAIGTLSAKLADEGATCDLGEKEVRFLWEKDGHPALLCGFDSPAGKILVEARDEGKPTARRLVFRPLSAYDQPSWGKGRRDEGVEGTTITLLEAALGENLDQVKLSAAAAITAPFAEHYVGRLPTPLFRVPVQDVREKALYVLRLSPRKESPYSPPPWHVSSLNVPDGVGKNPLAGYRTWYCRDGILNAYFSATQWEPREWTTARHPLGWLNGHGQDFAKCRCGLHAFHFLEEAIQLFTWALIPGVARQPVPCAGAILGVGGVAITLRGFRAKSARPLALLDPEAWLAGEVEKEIDGRGMPYSSSQVAVLADAARKAGAVYGVPVLAPRELEAYAEEHGERAVVFKGE